MERTLQLLMIAILATATYQFDLTYNAERVEEFARNVSDKNPKNVTLINADAQVQWKLENDEDDYGSDTLFVVENRSYDSKDCKGLPGLLVEDGQLACLQELVFGRFDDKKKGILRLGILFRSKSGKSNKTILVSSTMTAKPDDEAEDLSGVLQVEPLTKDQLEEVRKTKSFAGSTSWLRKVVEKGLYPFIEFDVHEGILTAYPSVMSEETLKEIISLPSILFPKT